MQIIWAAYIVHTLSGFVSLHPTNVGSFDSSQIVGLCTLEKLKDSSESYSIMIKRAFQIKINKDYMIVVISISILY